MKAGTYLISCLFFQQFLLGPYSPVLAQPANQPLTRSQSSTGAQSWESLQHESEALTTQPGLVSGAGSDSTQTGKKTDIQVLRTWFESYDSIRRRAQMNPSERASADALLSKGLSLMIPGPEKVATQKLLSEMSERYATAMSDIQKLPLYPETERLHRGYFQYFEAAHALFSDYLKVQGNLFATDKDGNPLAAGLASRKQSLEQLDIVNKQLDGRLRESLGIKPYSY